VKHNVLIFPCGTEIGLEIHRSLRYSTHFDVIGGSSVDDHGAYVYEKYIGEIPFVDDNDFITEINRVVEENNIEFIFPAHDSVLLRLAQARDNDELKCAVVAPPLETCEVARSKKKTYEFFDSLIKTPKIYNDLNSDDIEYPAFLKPDVGQGSKGTFKVNSKEESDFYIAKDVSLLVLEFLPGSEYTVDCFTNKEGELLYSEGRERRRISNGISVNSVYVQNPNFQKIAKVINNNLSLRGAWFFQLKENKEGDLVLLEIAPRIAGTMGLARARGVNLPLLSLFDLLDVQTSITASSYAITIDRALENSYRHDIEYKHVYIDFDDLVLLEEKDINPLVMAFVYQCINKGIKVHLITRHKADIENTLKKYRLSETFDEVIWLRDQNDEKHAYINPESAIFLDDSFAERKKVYDAYHIPVFDSHMIEALMEVK
jgi:hypothetical protein